MKKTVSLVVLCAAILALSGCGISRQQYDDVCAERDALLAELQAMQGSVPPEAAGRPLREASLRIWACWRWARR